MADLINRMTDLTMHGYFNDIHIINADRIPNCLMNLRAFNYPNRASLELLRAGAMHINGVVDEAVIIQLNIFNSCIHCCEYIPASGR